ncbi:MAG: DUF4443 domain-containing protein [Candidatus Ranarchaeia archaeon]
MRLIDFFRELAGEKAPGPFPSFSELHLAKAIELIGAEGPIGRKKLSKKLNLGEGVIRTIVSRLEKVHLIIISRIGCELTEKGKVIYDELSSKLVCVFQIDPNPLTIGAYNVGIMVRDAVEKVRYGVEQRDAAVKAGAEGAIMLMYKDQKLVVPTISEDMTKDFPSVAQTIMELFRPREKDVIILGGADSRNAAEDGARAAAWTLMET